MAALDNEVGAACRAELTGPRLNAVDEAAIARWRHVQIGRGEGALSWTALAHFQDVTGERLKPGEAEAILEIDHTYLAEVTRPARKG